MAWSPEELSKFEEIVSQLASESHLAKPGSDEGLIPIFSLVNEITWALPQEKELAEAVVAIQEMLQPMLDDAVPFDDASIEAMQSFARWCSDSLDHLRNDRPIESYLATSDGAGDSFQPAADPSATDDAAAPSFDEPAASAAEAQQTKLPSVDDVLTQAKAELDGETMDEQVMPEQHASDDIDAILAAASSTADEPDTSLEPELSTEPPPAADAPISFEEAKQEIRADVVLNDNWTADEIDNLSSIAQQFSAELLLADQGSDEGMLPVYSLLKDLERDFGDQIAVQKAIVPVLGKMDSLLDAAQAFDAYAIQILTEFNIWLEAALAEIATGRDPLPFSPSPDQTAPSGATNSGSSAATACKDPLLKEFEAHDVVMDLNLEENEELLQEFHTEAVDHLRQIESAVLELEQDVANRDAINSMFRSFHTIKGVAGFLNLVPINRLAHEVESLMDLVRNDKLKVFTGIIDLVLESKDTITRLIEQITQALSNGAVPDQVVPVSHLMARARWAMEGPVRYAELTGSRAAAETIAPADPAPAATDDSDEPDADASEEHDESAAQADPKVAAAAKRRAAENATIRVNTWKLDNLMDMVGELVIVQSQLLESARQDDSGINGNSVLQRNISQLTRITKDLQHTSMALRMIPIKPTFQKMGRIVRDLAAKSGKKVRFDVFGEETELDRNVVEEIGDPLVHMVRNALDHGLEPTEDRGDAGKDDTGTISLKAYHQGSNIVIELSDDGRGINADKVLKKAIANGIVQEGEQLTKEEIYKLIFAPGFSTAEKITDISGRGVGMDVVKKNIERLRGKIEITSELGKGSTFKILLPLTMAIVDGLVVKVGEDRFILPTTSVKVALRPDQNVLAKVQGNQEILNIRGRVIPLFRLHHHFSIPGAISDPREGTVVVVETGGKPCGLLVDDMVSKQEVVIKSLGGMMQGIPGVSGGAILGDGTIALILDPASLISAA